MEYRSDQEAARLRIDTLEAKLAEREASLHARETELVEREQEVSRLKRAQGLAANKKPTSPAVVFAVIAGVCALLGLAVVTAILVLMPASRRGSPTPAPLPTVIEEGPRAEGKTLAPPEEPPAPRAQAGGQAITGEGETLAEQTERAGDVMRGEAQACMRKEREKHPDAGGFVSAIYEIEPSGKVSSVKLSGLMASTPPWWSKEFEACLLGAYKKLTFRPFEGSKTTAKGTHFLSKTDLGI